jgi:hypothetical protein
LRKLLNLGCRYGYILEKGRTRHRGAKAPFIVGPQKGSHNYLRRKLSLISPLEKEESGSR